MLSKKAKGSTKEQSGMARVLLEVSQFRWCSIQMFCLWLQTKRTNKVKICYVSTKSSSLDGNMYLDICSGPV